MNNVMHVIKNIDFEMMKVYGVTFIANLLNLLNGVSDALVAISLVVASIYTIVKIYYKIKNKEYDSKNDDKKE